MLESSDRPDVVVAALPFDSSCESSTTLPSRRANSISCSQVPYPTEQAIFWSEQGIFNAERGIFSADRGIQIAILFRSAFGLETTEFLLKDEVSTRQRDPRASFATGRHSTVDLAGMFL